MQDSLEDVNKENVALKMANLDSMHSGMTICANLIIGPLYDVIGRKIPTLVMFMITTTGEFAVPFVKKYNPGFIICTFLQEPNVLLGLIPFVPDLIDESS
jgi:hypothetical protein